MSLYAERDTFHTLAPIENRLIGLSGFAQVGKDSVANILGEHGFKRVALADPIRSAMYMLDPVVRADNRGRTFGLREVVDDIGWDEAKTSIPEVRRLLQVFGTEVGRHLFGNDVWVDLARKKVNVGTSGRYVITDVRFLNEVTAIRALGGSLYKVVRPGYAPVNAHVSDVGLADQLFDGFIFNIGSLEDLRTAVLDLV